jgi:hypothetical protein
MSLCSRENRCGQTETKKNGAHFLDSTSRVHVDYWTIPEENLGVSEFLFHEANLFFKLQIIPFPAGKEIKDAFLQRHFEMSDNIAHNLVDTLTNEKILVIFMLLRFLA